MTLAKMMTSSVRAYNTRSQFVFAVLLDREVVRIAGFQLVEHDIHRVLEGLIVLSGYVIKSLNTINFRKSMHYNPFSYIRSEKDILKLVNTIIVNTKGDGSVVRTEL